MRSWLRAGRLMLGVGWEMGPAVFGSWMIVSMASSLGPFLFAIGLRPLVNGAVSKQAGGVALGGTLCGLAVLLLVATPAVGRWVFPRVIERSIMAMRRRLLTLVSTAPGLEHFERPQYADRLELLKRNFSDLVESAAAVVVGPLMIAQLAATAVILGHLQPWLLLFPLLGVPAGWLSKRAEQLRRRAEEGQAEPRRAAEHLFLLATSAHAAKEVRVYGLTGELLGRHAAVTARVERAGESALFRAAALASAGWLMLALGYVGAAYIVLRGAAEGRLSPGDVALAFTLAVTLVSASGQLSSMASMLLRAVTVADTYYWLAEQAPVSAVTMKPAARPPAAAVPARLNRGFELRGLSFCYGGSETPALDDVTIRLTAGSVVALVGENGAGKTTLVKLLCGMYRPSRGDILVDGTNLERFDVTEYRCRLAAGFQDFARFELLARESVGVGDLSRLTSTEAVRRALRKVNGDFAERLRAGLETQLGSAWTDGTDLSGGEWQKLALARAMMRASSLLVIFDEPTASLDPQTEHALFQQIAADRRASADGRITLLVSHRFSTVRMADLIIVLDRGRVVEHGSHDQLVAADGLYADLYRVQASAYR